MLSNKKLSRLYNFFKFMRRKKLIVLFSGSGKKDVFENITTIEKEFKRRRIRFVKTFKGDSYVNQVKMVWHIAAARCLVVDSQSPAAYLNISNKTILINCWHASGAFKTLGLDAIMCNTDISNEKKRVARIFRHTDYWVCSSALQAEIYRKALNLKQENMLALGIPRTDILLNDLSINECIKKKKIILYAPTFRGRKNRSVPPPFNLEMIDQRVKEKYLFAYRGHPTSCKNKKLHEGWTDYSDINPSEAIRNADVLITDYSSILFDFGLLQKPIILYMPDYYKYTTEDHNLYYRPEELVSSEYCCYGEEELNKVLLSDIRYKENKIIELMNKSCDGKATERLVSYILEKINV